MPKHHVRNQRKRKAPVMTRVSKSDPVWHIAGAGPSKPPATTTTTTIPTPPKTASLHPETVSRHQPQQPTFVLSDKLHECNNGNSFYSKLTIRNDIVGATNNRSEHCNEENDNDDNDPVEIEVGDVVVCLSTASSKVSWTCVQVLAIYSDHKYQQQQNDGDTTECKYRHMRIEGRKLYRRAELEGKVDYFPLYEPEQGRSRRTSVTTRTATGDEHKQRQQEEDEEEVFETDELLENFAVSRILSKPDLLLGNERRGSASKALVLRTRCWYHSTARRFQPIFFG